MGFTIKIDRYEGPYTKLLDLIETRKLSVTELSLAQVADDYISYIKNLDQKNIVDISQFIVVASTLMLMKVKSLLPGIVYTEEEEKQVHDLEYKLELYALLSQASNKVRLIYNKHKLYSRPYIQPKNIEIFIPDERVNVILLQSIALLTLRSFDIPKELTVIAVEQALRIENVIESLLERVRGAQSVSFKSLVNEVATKEEQKRVLIINFIALLELLRVGSLQATQPIDGGDITIVTPKDISTPQVVLQ